MNITKKNPVSGGASAPLPTKSPRDFLFPYQRRWADDTSRWKFGLMTRQTGKDFCSAEEGVRDCFEHERHGGKTTWLIAAPSERQSIESLTKWKEWTQAYKMAIANIREERDGGSEALLKSVTIEFPRGSRVIAVPGRPDTVRGYSANVLLTEFAFFENPEAIWRAIVPAVTNPMRGGEKKVRLITTPNGIGNKAHDIWTKNYRWGETPSNPESIESHGSTESLPINPNRMSRHFDGLPVDCSGHWFGGGIVDEDLFSPAAGPQPVQLSIDSF